MNSKYYLAVILAFVIYGLFSLPLKAIDEFPTLEILLSRLLISSALISLVCLIFRRKIALESIRIYRGSAKKEKRNLWLVNLVSAVMLAINWYLFIYVMNNISVNATALAYMLCPIITTILAFIFLKDRLSGIQWIAIGLSVFSCILLAVGNFIDVFYSFLIGLSYAVYLVLQKNNQKLDRFFTLTFQIVCGTLLLLPLFFYPENGPGKTPFFYGIIFIIAGLFTILPMYLNVFSLNKLNSSTAGVFIYMNPIISFMLALFYFKEAMDTGKTIAYSIVFLSVILFNAKIIAQLFLGKGKNWRSHNRGSMD